jgi:glutathione S-transferase
MCAYLFYPADEFKFDIRKDHPAISAWLDRIQALPNWAHPYDLMAGYPFGTQLLNGKPVS